LAVKLDSETAARRAAVNCFRFVVDSVGDHLTGDINLSWKEYRDPFTMTA
jgi:hypothetical protein